MTASPEAIEAIRAGEAATRLTPAEMITACRALITGHSDPRSANYEAIDGPDPEYFPHGSRIADELADREEARETRWREYDGRRWR